MINVLGKSNSSSIYIYNIAFCVARLEYGVCAFIFGWFPFSLGEEPRVLISLIVARIRNGSSYPAFAVYSTIRRNNSLIRRRLHGVVRGKGLGGEWGEGGSWLDVVGAGGLRRASRRIYSVVTAVETMKFNAANLHANPRDVNPASARTLRPDVSKL